MPCVTDTHADDAHERKELRRMLCGLCRRTPEQERIDADPVLAFWWANHLASDAEEAARIEKDRKASRILKQIKKKLTPQEQEVLGIR